MQKIMVIMLFWLLMPFYSWAISLEEIQSHPERYVKMDESRSCINYIDAESIHSLRCDPPYYTLLGDVYYVGRSDNLIFKVIEVFCYDYQRSRRETSDLRWCIKGSYCKIINAGEKKIIYGLPGYAATVHFSYAGNSQSVFFTITQEGENNGRYQTIFMYQTKRG